MRLKGEASLACLATTVLHTISYGTDYFGVLFYEVFAYPIKHTLLLQLLYKETYYAYASLEYETRHAPTLMVLLSI